MMFFPVGCFCFQHKGDDELGQNMAIEIVNGSSKTSPAVWREADKKQKAKRGANITSVFFEYKMRQSAPRATESFWPLSQNPGC